MVTLVTLAMVKGDFVYSFLQYSVCILFDSISPDLVLTGAGCGARVLRYRDADNMAIKVGKFGVPVALTWSEAPSVVMGVILFFAGTQ